MKEEQKAIYYAAGESIAKVDMLPQVATVKAKGYEVLYLTDDVDEFAIKLLDKYADKEFKNVTAEALDLTSEDEKESIKVKNESAEDMLAIMKDAIGKVSAVRFTASLKNHPVCLSSEGDISLEMEKTLGKMPGADAMAPKASIVLEINASHPIASKLEEVYESDKDKLKKYAKLLYAQGCLIGGAPIDDPKELTELISELMI